MRTAGALLGAGTSIVTFGLFFADAGQVIAGGAHVLGTGLVLQDNAAYDLVIASNGNFSFTTPLATGASYTVTVKSKAGKLIARDAAQVKVKAGTYRVTSITKYRTVTNSPVRVNTVTTVPAGAIAADCQVVAWSDETLIDSELQSLVDGFLLYLL